MTDADFGGWATRHDVQCADGRTILPGAFQDQDGAIVPLVYQHGHTSNEDVLGHARLEYVPPSDGNAGGMYAHAFFNKTPKGQMAKEQVEHGDLKFLSIFANDLREKARAGVQHAKDVMKGNIREVSLVLAGANPGAFIDHISFAHGEEGEFETAAVISMGLEVDLQDSLLHADGDAASDDNEETLQDILDTLDEKQSTAVNFLLSQALTHSDLEESSSDAGTDEAAANEGEAAGDAGDAPASDAPADEAPADNEADAVGDDDTNTDGDNATDAAPGTDASGDDNLQEDTSMSHNIFDQSGTAGARPSASLQHGTTSLEDALRAVVKDAKRNGSLKEALENYIEHTGIMVNGTLQHGVENLDYLFPDAKTIESSPAWIARRMEWVDKVLNGVRKSPFSRIKTITADITPDEARARGYIKGNFKNEEFFALSKRETTPQTIYKKQKLDRDDVIDITTLDVIAWLKAEMKVMLDEELAAAILVGDGRSIGDEDKILENHIRPIASDAELYVTTVRVNTDDADSTVEELVDAVIANRRYYKGSGTPTFFTTESTISAFLTVKDNFGRRLYSNLSEVAAVLRVSEVVPVEVMERVEDLVGIMVNLSDYTLGADRGGQATMFDDFDIDYNKLIYLIETRCSGALTQPKAAIVFRKVDAALELVEPQEPDFDGDTVTVPTQTGVVYKNADTNAVLTTAAPVAVAEGSALNVVATPAAGYYFGNSETDQWTFSNRPA
jgi:phage head maturation protease